MDGESQQRNSPRSVFAVLWLVFFLQGMMLGFWLPALTNILVARDLRDWVPTVFMVIPICSLISPVIGGALADQRVPANRLYAWSSIIGAVALAAAFFVLDRGWHPGLFVALLTCWAMLFAPSFGLLTTISLTHLSSGERLFPLVRVGATIGWICAGLLTSFALRADVSPLAGYAGAMVSLMMGLVALGMPNTPPLGKKGIGLRQRLGLDAFVLLKERDHAVFFGVTALFSIPLAAFYMYGPEFLKILGDDHPTGTMTVAQGLEVISLIFLGSVITRFRVKTVLSLALGFSVLRFAMSAVAGVNGQMGWHVGGIALHGLCYAFYFITAQVYLDRRVDPAMKGRTQGLLSMVSSGVGPLIGVLFCGWLRQTCVTADGKGWEWFWGVLAAIIACCLVIFLMFYRSLGKPQQHSSCEFTCEADCRNHG